MARLKATATLGAKKVTQMLKRGRQTIKGRKKPAQKISGNGVKAASGAVKRTHRFCPGTGLGLSVLL